LFTSRLSSELILLKYKKLQTLTVGTCAGPLEVRDQFW